MVPDWLTPHRRPYGTAVLATVLAGLALAGGLQSVAFPSQEQAPSRREFTVKGDAYSFEPATLQVRQDDLVKITFHADDIAHSFTIDAYRIAKRAGAGQAVVFEFRADRAGRFPFYCNLTIDDRCREMRGELVVTPR